MNKMPEATKVRHKDSVIEALCVYVSFTLCSLLGATLQIVPHFMRSLLQTLTHFRRIIATCFCWDWPQGADEYFVKDIHLCPYGLKYSWFSTGLNSAPTTKFILYYTSTVHIKYSVNLIILDAVSRLIIWNDVVSKFILYIFSNEMRKPISNIWNDKNWQFILNSHIEVSL